MPYWIVADTGDHKRGLMGPYVTEMGAQDVKDGLDDGHAQVYQTESNQRSIAAQEIRHKLVKEGGIDQGFKNFRHKGVEA